MKQYLEKGVYYRANFPNALLRPQYWPFADFDRTSANSSLDYGAENGVTGTRILQKHFEGSKSHLDKSI